MTNSPQTSAAHMSALLRDVVEVTSRQQQTIDSQVKNGFVEWLEAAIDLPGVSSTWVTKPGEPTETVLRVSKPSGPAPKHPGVDPSAWPENSPQYLEATRAIEAYENELQIWEHHAGLYDSLFNARTPIDGMETVFAIGLLESGSGSEFVQRHMVTYPVDISLNRQSGQLSVDLSDAARLELNWMDPANRSVLSQAEESLRRLEDAQTHHEAVQATAHIRASFGLQGFDIQLQTKPPLGSVGVGVMPAILHRKRDSSALLQLLRDMTRDMESGGFVSEPFRMIVSESYLPEQIEVLTDRAALALEANDEQRSMIDRARREPHLVIQGPPGTGKTHTIANLASVLMAEGRRVLITAENERALEEVQGKLPPEMRPLMLPMLKERGKGALQASVNSLSSKATSRVDTSERQHKQQNALAKLEELENSRELNQRKLARIAEQQHEERSFHGSSLPVHGHQIILSEREEELALVDRFLSPNGLLPSEDAQAIVSLGRVVRDTHRDLAEHTFPGSLLPPESVAQHIGEYQSELGTLGPPSTVDPQELVNLDSTLKSLVQSLHTYPVIGWTEITRTPEDYSNAADNAAAVAKDINHGVTVEPVGAVAQAIGLCESYLALDEKRFSRPTDLLVEEHRAAKAHVDQSEIQGRFTDTSAAKQLTKKCEDSLRLLRDDRTGLLSRFAQDLVHRGYSDLSTISEEAAMLFEDSRDEVGLPVTIDSTEPAFHRLLEQAEALRDHYAAGGKSTRRLGLPKPVRDAADLIEQVRVGGSKIDNESEAERAIGHLRYRQQMEIADSWAQENNLRQPEAMPLHEWLRELSILAGNASQIVSALNSTEDLVSFSSDTSDLSPKELLHGALAAVGQEVVDKLDSFVGVAVSAPRVAIAGREIASREAASAALAALRAGEIRRSLHSLLPEPWAGRCNPLNVDVGDDLVDALSVCEQAATVPALARRAELHPEAVSLIREEAGRERRRAQAEQKLDETVGEIQRSLMACVPKSPATQALDEALSELDAYGYRIAWENVQKEMDMAAQATRLDQARQAVASAHPRLLAAIDIEDSAVERVLLNIEELESLYDYRLAVDEWVAELGSANEVHEELARLHNQIQATESSLASLRCWDKAVERLEGRRELRSALSALSTAMDRVPKTKTAKSYPARVRALRKATEEAAPAIPCWVLSIDRIAEVLGYATSDQRFDVVIIDEASQAWFPAIFLYAIADQVIVVGDKQQTSPSQVMSGDIITSLTREWIPGHRLEDQIGDDLSLYDTAEIMTGPDMMVDHFRCVPEIIEISNRLSYEPMGKSLKPLRVRKPGAMAPLHHVRVAGIRDSKTAANHAEITALVEQVVKCHGDPAYDDMDFGVVVVGPSPTAHLKHLRTALLAELGATAMSERNIEVGTAGQFQGAERNVMFLSLIVCPDHSGRIRLWPHEHTGRNRRHVQQLNVAASRARDQLWIYHSFDVQHLAPNDARAVLLEAAPAAQQDPESAFAGCETQFERDVFSAIAEADPSLIISTQVEALGYSIDIVIDTPDGDRLAVECDGDPYHSSDSQIRKDLYRQRVLETVGWRFHRFLASEWYGDPEKHVSEILAALPEPKKPVPDVVSEPKFRPQPEDLPPPPVIQHQTHPSKPVEKASVSERGNETAVPSGSSESAVSVQPKAAVDDGEERAKRARLESLARSTVVSPRKNMILEEYVAWDETQLANLASADVEELVRSIVEVEGPVAMQRIVALVDEASLSSIDRAMVVKHVAGEDAAAYSVWKQWGGSYHNSWVRLSSQPYARPRKLGPRTLEEVPPSELAVLFERLIERGHTERAELYALARRQLGYQGSKAATRELFRKAHLKASS